MEQSRRQVIETSALCEANCSESSARQEFGRLEAWAMNEALGLPEHEVEAELEIRGREVNRRVLENHLKHRGSGRVGAAIQVRGESGVLRHEASVERERKITSIFGDVRAERTAYAAKGQDSVHPLR